MGKEWFAKKVNGTPGSIPPYHIPVYGNLKFDEYEEAAMRVPPDFPTLGRITLNNCKYETLLLRTKLRYSRKKEGSPKEQELEAAAGPEHLSSPEEIIWEEQQREVYNPDSKVLNFGKLKATDMRNNPRIMLPKPRPMNEESE